jgi:hypothetical protein
MVTPRDYIADWIADTFSNGLAPGAGTRTG